MNSNVKYIGMDVHQATISIAVLDATGKLVMESIIETKAATILEFIHGLRGNLWVTFEEGTSAGSQRSSTASAMKPSANCRCRRRAAITADAPVLWSPRGPGVIGIDSAR